MDEPKTAGAGETEVGTESRECPVNGCTTWYDDPAVMLRHLQRQHGLFLPGKKTPPTPRKEGPGDPELVRWNAELEDRHELVRPGDWDRPLFKR